MEYLSLHRYKNVGFDFNNSTINFNSKSKKVVEDLECIFKVQKTQIKALGGIKGLYDFMSKIANDGFGYGWFAKIVDGI